MKWADIWAMPRGEIREYVDQLPDVVHLLTGNELESQADDDE